MTEAMLETKSAEQAALGAEEWRLADVKELISLINYQAKSPADWLTEQGFKNVQSSYYWSSTSYASNTSNAWFVYLDDGSVGADGKSYFNYVWPVRSGQVDPSVIEDKFVDNGDGTITDHKTGLIWMQKPVEQMTWQEAIDYCKELNKKEIRHDCELEEF
ncbi:MAG: DUF1566 domain-containing protein [Nitrospirae bacterium]|nr:DUF1566 domain-containing protein [Nitrospirota bacterium]